MNKIAKVIALQYEEVVKYQKEIDDFRAMMKVELKEYKTDCEKAESQALKAIQKFEKLEVVKAQEIQMLEMQARLNKRAKLGN